MFARRAAKILVVATLVFSLGLHWAFLQTLAWVGMAIQYSQDAPLHIAIEKTFDGKHPCRMCKTVEEGKASEKKSEREVETKKLDFFVREAAEFFFPPTRQNPEFRPGSFTPRHKAPPTPPPILA